MDDLRSLIAGDQPAAKTSSGNPTKEQILGRSDLATHVQGLQATLADTVPGSPTYQRITQSIAEAQKELGAQQPTQQPAQEPSGDPLRDLISGSSATQPTGPVAPAGGGRGSYAEFNPAEAANTPTTRGPNPPGESQVGLLAAVGGLGVEIHRVLRICQLVGEICADARHSGAMSKRLKFGAVASDQYRVRHDDSIRRDFYSALFDDGCDGTQQVLVAAHTAGDAVHDNPDAMCFDDAHLFRLLRNVWEVLCIVFAPRLGAAALRRPPPAVCLQVPAASGRHRPQVRNSTSF